MTALLQRNLAEHRELFSQIQTVDDVIGQTGEPYGLVEEHLGFA